MGSGGGSVFDPLPAESLRATASVRGVFARAWLLGGVSGRVSSMSPRVRIWAFRVAGVKNQGSVGAALDRGLAFRVVGVHFAWQAWGSGCTSALGRELRRWIRVAGVGNRTPCALTLLSVRFARQQWGNVRFDVAQRAFRVAGV